jgi:transglutaminase-like putative cysteine protease
MRGVVLAGLAGVGVTGPAGLGLALGAAALLWLPAPRLPGAVWIAAHAAVLLVTGLLAVLVAPTGAFALLVAWLLVHRSWTGRTADDARVALLLATLLLLLGAVGTESIALGPLFVVFALLLPVALLRAELHAGGDPAPRGAEAAVGVTVAVLGGSLFLVLPRLDAGYFGRDAGGAGRFPEDVTLGEEGLVSDDGAEVMRVRVTDREGRPVPGPFYLRGRSLDRFDGARWSAAAPIDRAPFDAAWDRRAEVELEPIGGDLLFALPDVLRVEGLPVRAERGGAFAPLLPGRMLRYTALSRTVALDGITEDEPGLWLQLPPNMDGRVTTLAWTVAPPEETDAAEVARALAGWLSANYAYVDTPPPPTGDPLAWFLFEEKSGHCEYFASALTVLLRARGIPARLATGFHSGELGDDGWIIVRRGNAHAWVEVKTAGGWATLDATPTSALPTVDASSLRAQLDALLAAWYRDVVEYDMDAQIGAYGLVGKRVLLATGSTTPSPIRAGLVGMVVVLGVGGFLLVGGRAALTRFGSPARPRPDEGVRLAAEARLILRRRGWELPPELPPLAAAAWLEDRVGPAAAPLGNLARLLYESRYGGAPLPLDEARANLRALRRVPRPARIATAGG